MKGIGNVDKMFHISAAKYLAISLIAKDAVGCVMYTSTARANKQYTPEKRSDVSNYDLANGVINIGLQLLAINPIEKMMKSISENDIIPKMYKNFNEIINGKDIKKAVKMSGTAKKAVEGSVAVLSMIACQYIIKRFIAPYISMPTGDKLAEKGVIKPKLYEGEEYRGKVGKAKKASNAEKVNAQA